MATQEQIKKEITTLEATEIHVETNQGTFGASECLRKVGCGDPAFANREVYETVGGRRRSTGPDAENAPGRMRKINADEMGRMRKRLADLRRESRRHSGAGKKGEK